MDRNLQRGAEAEEDKHVVVASEANMTSRWRQTASFVSTYLVCGHRHHFSALPPTNQSINHWQIKALRGLMLCLFRLFCDLRKWRLSIHQLIFGLSTYVSQTISWVANYERLFGLAERANHFRSWISMMGNFLGVASVWSKPNVCWNFRN